MLPTDKFPSPSLKPQNPNQFENPLLLSNEQGEIQQPAMIGTLKERLLKKAWKIKSDALDELLALITNPSQEQEIYQYSGMFHFLLLESHPTALQKAIDCLCAYLKNQAFKKIQDLQTLFKTLLERGYAASKPSIQEKALETILLILRRHPEQIQISIPVLECMKSRVIKIQIAAINFARELLSKLGIHSIPFKNLLQPLEGLASHQNSLIRSAVLAFYQESYIWLGQNLRPLLSHLKPAQIVKNNFTLQAELDKKFAVAKLKSARSPSAKKVSPKTSSGKKVKAVPIMVIDPYECAKEVNPWSRFNSDWMENVLKLPKWEQKQEQLDQLTKTCDVIKIRPQGIQGVLPGLRSMMASPNANISTASIQTLCMIAKGTRHHFKAHSKGLISMLMMKYKEKKPSLLKAVHETLQILGKCFTDHLTQVLDQILGLLGDKNPTVKINSLHWIKTNVLGSSSLKDIRVVADAITQPMKKLLYDSQAEVRDAALELMGTVRGRLGPDCMNNLYQDLNPPKKKKVSEAMNETMKEFGQHPQPKVQEKKGPSPFKLEQRPAPHKMKRSNGFHQESKHLPPKPMRENILAENKPTIKAGPEEVKFSAYLTKQEAEEMLIQMIGASLISGLESTIWKEKNTSIQNIITWSQEQNDISEQLVEALIVHLKGKMRDFKESNVILGKSWISLITALAKRDYLTRKVTNLFFPALLQKYPDSKFKSCAQECIFSVASSLGPGFVAKLIVNISKDAKNPNIIKEGCNLLIQLPKEFGSVHGLPIKEILNKGKLAITHNNVAVRKSGSDLLVNYYRWLGEKSKQLVIADVKENAVKSLESQIDKVVPFQQGEFPPKRELQGEAARQEQLNKNKKRGPEALLDSMIPRKDISGQISRKLLRDCSDPNGKLRMETLEKIQTLIHQAGDRIQLNGTAELVGVLSTRLKEESNNKIAIKNLVGTIGILGYALGKLAVKIKGKFFPQLLDILSNKAPEVRQAVVAALDSWASSIGPQGIFNYIPERLKHQSPEIRVELLDWTAEQIKRRQGPFNYDLLTFVKPLTTSLVSKDSKVRISAERLLAELGPLIGRAPFQTQIKHSGQTQIIQLKHLLEKYAPSEVPGPSFTLKKVQSEKSLHKMNQLAPALHPPMKQQKESQLLYSQPKANKNPVAIPDIPEEMSQSQTDTASQCSKKQQLRSRIGKGFGFGRLPHGLKFTKPKAIERQEFNSLEQVNSMEQGIEISQETRLNAVKPFTIHEEEKREKSWKQEFIDRQFDELVDLLKYGDAKEKRKGLQILCGWITTEQNYKFLEGRKVNEIIDGILCILNHDLEGYEQTIPFIFQFLEVSLSLVKNEAVMARIKEHRLFRLLEQLVIKIIYFTKYIGTIQQMNQLEELSQSESDWNPEEQISVQQIERELKKRFKSILRKVLMNSNPTLLFCVLMKLLEKYSMDGMRIELTSLIARTILSFSNIMDKFKEKLKLDKMLFNIHEFYKISDSEVKSGNNLELGDQAVLAVLKVVHKLYEKKEIEEAQKLIKEDEREHSILLQKLKIFGNSNRVSRNSTEHKDTERKNEEKSDDKKEGKLPSSRLDKIREKLSVLQKKMFN